MSKTLNWPISFLLSKQTTKKTKTQFRATAFFFFFFFFYYSKVQCRRKPHSSSGPFNGKRQKKIHSENSTHASRVVYGFFPRCQINQLLKTFIFPFFVTLYFIIIRYHFFRCSTREASSPPKNKKHNSRNQSSIISC